MTARIPRLGRVAALAPPVDVARWTEQATREAGERAAAIDLADLSAWAEAEGCPALPADSCAVLVSMLRDLYRIQEGRRARARLIAEAEADRRGRLADAARDAVCRACGLDSADLTPDRARTLLEQAWQQAHDLVGEARTPSARAAATRAATWHDRLHDHLEAAGLIPHDQEMR